jgi:5-methylcytosine-specific restriction endonuclease McrA
MKYSAPKGSGFFQSSHLEHMQTLLLDTYYQPLGIIGWQKAINLVIQEKAEILKPGEQFVSSISIKFNVPRVLRLFRRGYHKYKASFSKRSVFMRDRGACAYCNIQMSYKAATIDHVVPRCQGGTNSWTNVVTACQTCNGKKAGRTPPQAGMRLLYQPYVPSRMELIKRLIEDSGFGNDSFFKNY